MSMFKEHQCFAQRFDKTWPNVLNVHMIAIWLANKGLNEILVRQHNRLKEISCINLSAGIMHTAGQ